MSGAGQGTGPWHPAAGSGLYHPVSRPRRKGGSFCFPGVMLQNPIEDFLSQFGSHFHLEANRWLGNLKMLFLSSVL